MLVNAFAKDFEYFSVKMGILFSLKVKKEPMKCEFPHNFIGSVDLIADYILLCLINQNLPFQ